MRLLQARSLRPCQGGRGQPRAQAHSWAARGGRSLMLPLSRLPGGAQRLSPPCHGASPPCLSRVPAQESQGDLGQVWTRGHFLGWVPGPSFSGATDVHALPVRGAKGLRVPRGWRQVQPHSGTAVLVLSISGPEDTGPPGQVPGPGLVSGGRSRPALSGRSEPVGVHPLDAQGCRPQAGPLCGEHRSSADAARMLQALPSRRPLSLPMGAPVAPPSPPPPSWGRG